MYFFLAVAPSCVFRHAFIIDLCDTQPFWNSQIKVKTLSTFPIQFLKLIMCAPRLTCKILWYFCVLINTIPNMSSYAGVRFSLAWTVLSKPSFWEVAVTLKNVHISIMSKLLKGVVKINPIGLTPLPFGKKHTHLHKIIFLYFSCNPLNPTI